MKWKILLVETGDAPSILTGGVIKEDVPLPTDGDVTVTELDTTSCDEMSLSLTTITSSPSLPSFTGSLFTSTSYRKKRLNKTHTYWTTALNCG